MGSIKGSEVFSRRPFCDLLSGRQGLPRLQKSHRPTVTPPQADMPHPAEDSWGTATVPDYWEYGHLVGHLSAYALSLQYLNVPYVSPDTMVGKGPAGGSGVDVGLPPRPLLRSLNTHGCAFGHPSPPPRPPASHALGRPERMTGRSRHSPILLSQWVSKGDNHLWLTKS